MERDPQAHEFAPTPPVAPDIPKSLQAAMFREGIERSARVGGIARARASLGFRRRTDEIPAAKLHGIEFERASGGFDEVLERYRIFDAARG
jgi:hypothetical protein